MPNVFDQFDAPAAAATGSGNIFDRFDDPKSQPRNGPPPPVNPDGSARRAIPSSFLEGIPIAGPLIKGGLDRAAAEARHLIKGESYDDTLRALQQSDAADLAAHPYIRTAGNIAGATAATLPMIAAAPAAFGVGEGPLLVRSGVSAVTGSGIGATDAGVRSGGDPSAILHGAEIGFGTGLVGPAIGKVAGTAYQGLKRAFTSDPALAAAGLTRSSAKDIAGLMQADGLDAPAVNQRLADLGPNAMLADVGPNLQQRVGQIAVRPGEPRQIITQAILDRDAAANARIRGTLDTELGPAPVPSRVDAGIRADQRALSPEYEAAFASARRVDTTPIANDLDSAVVNLRGPAQSAASDVRRMLNVTGTDQLDPNPRTLFQTRQAIDGLLENETNPKVVRVLTDARQAVDSHLAQAVPGIKDVDAKFAELARQRDALARGLELLRNGPNAVRPQELADELATGAQPRGASVGPSAVPLRLRQGARADLDRIVGTSANDRAALQRLIAGAGDWNPQKLAQLFGQDRADRILQVLHAERTFADTSQFALRGSNTAARLPSDEPGVVFGIPEAYAAGGLLGATRATAVKGTRKVVDAILASQIAAKNSAVARGLVSSQPQTISDLVFQSRLPMASSPHIENVARALALASTAPSRR